MIGYTCKYTPIELLRALGGSCVLLNEEAQDFQAAEEQTHSNLCCHAKAILQACQAASVNELVLVNCCDSMRRVFDLLQENGTFDFLFLLDLPHQDGPCAKKHLARELCRLAEAYRAFHGRSFSEEQFRTAFEEPSPLPGTPFLALLGARAGDRLLASLRAASPLPIADLTCGGNRALPRPAGTQEFPQWMDWYAGELLSQIPCLRMEKAGPRRTLWNAPHLSGILYHTVKFCDYYSFEYEVLKKESPLPTLKFETDFTLQPSGQLSTRLEAFLERLQPNPQQVPALQQKGKVLAAGIDSGSTTTNLAVVDEQGALCAWVIVRTGPKAGTGAEKAFQELEEKFHIPKSALNAIVATGYGRNAIPCVSGTKTEITCHARGAHFLHPRARTIIDIGGQDSKVICLDESGAVKNFVMNDKCAAGTGRFLEMMARTLELNMDQMGREGLHWKENLTISSMCTVFAESEVISLIAEDKSAADIIHGLNQAVASKTAALTHRADGYAPYMMTGGVARNPGVVQALEEKLGAPLWIGEQPDLCGAWGAALFALEQLGIDPGQTHRI